MRLAGSADGVEDLDQAPALGQAAECLRRAGDSPAHRGVVGHRSDGRLAAAGIDLRGGGGNEGEGGKLGLHVFGAEGPGRVAAPGDGRRGDESPGDGCMAASTHARVAQRSSSALLEKPSARACSSVAISCSESKTRIDFTCTALHRNAFSARR